MRDIPIKRAQVFGMRCSGTNYLDALIGHNMPSLQLGATAPTNDKTFGWKHGDAGTKAYVHDNGRLREADIMPLDWPSSRNTLLLVVHRNPLSWLQSLHRNPHQSPESFGTSFSAFIRQPFRAFHCDPPGSESHPNKRVRQRQIKNSRLLESFESPFELRKVRIAVFDSFRYRFHNVAYVNLETLEQDPKGFIQELADHFKLRTTASFKDITTYKGGDAPFTKSQYDDLNYEDLQHMVASIDWEAEAPIGYRVKFGSTLLTRHPKTLSEPTTLLNIAPYRQYYRNTKSLLA